MQEIVVLHGHNGHSQLSVNKSKEIIVQSEPKGFTALCLGNKVKEVIELMRFKDIPIESILIEEYKGELK